MKHPFGFPINIYVFEHEALSATEEGAAFLSVCHRRVLTHFFAAFFRELTFRLLTVF